MNNPSPQNVKKFFDNYFEADLKIWEEFSLYLVCREFERNETIKEYNSVEKYLNIIVKGSAGLFVWDGQNDVCINLSYENNFICDYFSFLKQQKTAIKSQALEECWVWSMRYDNLQELYKKSVIGVQVGKFIAEELFIKKQSEQIDLLTLSPIECYKKILSEKPQILQRTPLKIIASYLGVMPESLSRIRKKI